jgi:hypothetical protein
MGRTSWATGRSREERTQMRQSSPALIVIGLLGAMDAASAAPGNSQFCIQGCDFGGGLGDCSFSSYAQCQATASGRDASCIANPYFNANTAPQPTRNHLSRRKY